MINNGLEVLHGRGEWGQEGEVAIIMALIGFGEEVIAQKTCVPLIILALYTTLVVPPFIKIFLRNASEQNNE